MLVKVTQSVVTVMFQNLEDLIEWEFSVPIIPEVHERLVNKASNRMICKGEIIFIFKSLPERTRMHNVVYHVLTKQHCGWIAIFDSLNWFTKCDVLPK